MAVTIGDTFLVNTGNTYGAQVEPDLAGNAEGGFVVAWKSEFRREDDWDSPYEIAARSFTAGAPMGQEFIVNLIREDRQFDPAVVARPDGSFAIVYSSGEENHLEGTSANTRYIDADGMPVGPEYLTRYTYYHWNVDSAAFADGRIVTVWSEEDEGKGEIRSADGTAVESSFTFGSDWSALPKAVAVLDDSRFVVAWRGERELWPDEPDPALYGRIMGGAGDDIVFKIDADPAYEASSDPVITTLTTGDFVVTWQRYGDVVARIFDTQGVAVTGLITVPAITAGEQFNADIAALDDGRFVVTWQDRQDPLYASSVRAQIFAADGNRLGAEIAVTEVTSVDSGDPAVTSLGEDRFAIGWVGDEGNAGSDGGVFVQLYAADGAPAGIEADGSALADTLEGGFGDDRLRAGAGADRVYAGFGDDEIWGEKGEDLLYGGGGDDRLWGGWQSDRLYGEIGDDTLYGDVATIGTGSRGANDRLEGGEGNDTLYGDGQTMAAGGHGGNDVLLGGDGDDRLYGDAGDGAGLLTGGGDDTLEGGWGQDQMWGGGGDDRFYFRGLSGTDIIWDFGQTEGNRDILDLRETRAAFDPFEFSIYQQGSNTVVYFGSGQVTLIGVTALDPSQIWL